MTSGEDYPYLDPCGFIGEAQVNSSASPASGEVNWTELVQRIRQGDDSGMQELYRIFAKGVRFLLLRQLGAQELNDRVHDTFLIVVGAIQRGEMRDPERLMGFVQTVVQRQIAASINQSIRGRRDNVDFGSCSEPAERCKDPEQTVAFRERVELMKAVLLELSARDREILTQFYLDEKSQETICLEMNLNETQFRLLKSRAKARFGELGRKMLRHKLRKSVFYERHTFSLVSRSTYRQHT